MDDVDDPVRDLLSGGIVNDDVAAVGVETLLLVEVRCPPNPFWFCC